MGSGPPVASLECENHRLLGVPWLEKRKPGDPLAGCQLFKLFGLV